MTSITLVRPASAPMVMTCEAVARPRSINARAIGASILTSCHGTMPVSTAATENIQHRAHHQGNDDADRQIPLRVLGLLRGGGHRIESDISEEDVGRPRSDAGEAVGREGGPVVPPVGGVDEPGSDGNDEQHHRYLDHDDGGVKAGAFLDSDHQDRGDEQGDEECRQIEPDFHAEDGGRVQQVLGALDERRATGRP